MREQDIDWDMLDPMLQRQQQPSNHRLFITTAAMEKNEALSMSLQPNKPLQLFKEQVETEISFNTRQEDTRPPSMYSCCASSLINKN